ncbi:putative bifunctional diguanylate cyclase/phosphodiesterase [Sphingomonas xinjiangensis]|uniref:Diguanylate cyclase (GGDEF)-like protein n=1 Tax=Sphingomonas xinjiangensis TaxID=643568 RepID=A0A840Y8B6_9SPHN|nr:bifunctional diguanylate cyclase/phosphodiesterase [Sphingomonas xinjiangensis]MBB5709557.1 diguanylate cyclase (GGDEF)-like protein [Sphingomonas xinjiangensis]
MSVGVSRLADRQASDLDGPCEDNCGPHTDAFAALLELLPVPAVIVQLQLDGLHFGAFNTPFQLSGFGGNAATSSLIRALESDIRSFLESDQVQMEFAWQLGEQVDCRRFLVMLARQSVHGDLPHCLVTLVDQTGELRTEHSLRREMAIDSLTGLPNRSGFADVLEARVQPDTVSKFAVLVINLDRFSRVNACLGGIAGDELLISVARRLKGALRGHDILARMGGDEFGVLLSVEDGYADAAQVAKRIQTALVTPFRLSDFEIRVDCAIGMALGAELSGDVEDLIRHAQFAVKRAKKSGRVEVYHMRTFDIAREQFGIETELRRAIENGEMTLHYQPIWDFASGRITSFEALARWTSESGVRRSPDIFIPVAEESGLIIPLGRWAMDEAARTLASWDLQSGGNCGVKVAVNLSAIQLQRDNVPDLVQSVLERHGMAGDRFTLELTESAIVSDPDGVSRIMLALKALGTTLAMDDFGTGYSNLAYLQRLPIDLLKIDRSFVSGMLADRDKIAIVRAILGLAQALGMRTIAEGVESVELSQTLAALGCTFGQGFFYAQPLDQDTAYRYLGSRNT